MKTSVLVAGFLVALPGLAVAAYRDSNEAVSAQTQMNGGGCYPQGWREPRRG